MFLWGKTAGFYNISVTEAQCLLEYMKTSNIEYTVFPQSLVSWFKISLMKGYS